MIRGNLHSVGRLVVTALAWFASAGCFGCSSSGDATESGLTATSRSALELEQAPYLKHLYNRDGQLFLRQAHVPSWPDLQGPSFDELIHLQNVGADGTVLGEIHGNFPGRCFEGVCYNAVTNGGVAATVHGNTDWIVWADQNKIFVKELAPANQLTSTALVWETPGDITSAPAIASFEGNLVVLWTEEFRMRSAVSADGVTWSSPTALDVTEFNYGPYLSASEFQGGLYVASVLAGSKVRLQEVTPFAKGAAFELADTPSAVLDGSVSLARMNDDVLAIAFGHAATTQVVYTQDVGTFSGPYTLLDFGSTVRLPLAFGATEPDPTLYALAVDSGGSLYRATKPASELLSGTPAPLQSFNYASEPGRGGGVLYQSAYAHGDTLENTFDFELLTQECDRRIQFVKKWRVLEPEDVTGYEVLLNGRLVTTFPDEAPQPGFELFAIPNYDHEIQLRVLKADGTSLPPTPPKTFHFEPCANRTFQVAFVRTRFLESPEPEPTLTEMQDMFTQAADYFAQVSGGELTLTGGVVDGLPIEAPLSDYCEEIADGWGEKCTGLSGAAEAANPQLSDYEFRVYLIGGRSQPNEPGSAGGNLVEISGNLGFKVTGMTFVHEVGHLLGLEHAGTWAGACVQPPPDVFDLTEQQTCVSPYGDRFDAMGSHGIDEGTAKFPPRGFAAYNGELLGYLNVDQHTTVVDTGEHEIVPLKQAVASGGIAELRTPIDGDVNTFYSIEYRGDEDNGSHGFVTRLHLAGLDQQRAVGRGNPESLNFPAYRSLLKDPFQRIKFERVGIALAGTEVSSVRVRVTLPSTYDSDGDGDGLSDGEDNCSGVWNPEQIDQSHDGLGDVCDPDRDGDTFPNQVDLCPDDPETLQADIDGDGIGDVCDTNADGDDFDNQVDNCPFVANDQADFDGDGTGDACDDNSLVADAGADQIVECQGAGKAGVTLDGSGSGAPGAQVTYAWSAPVALSGASQALATGNFPLGTHTVNLTVGLGGFSATDSAQVTVRDTTAPVLTVPADVVTSTCTSVSIGQATAVDACGGNVTPTNDAPASFRAGSYVITWRAVDAAGNPAVKTQRVVVGLGDNAACCPSGSNVIQGGPNADTLTGTSGADCILGKNGQDTLRGMGGNDIISGGEGNDVLEGGSGNDFLDGGSGQDTVRGQDGNDVLAGQGGDDFCYGGNDDDSLHGGAGQDRLYGESGHDQLFGNDGDDVLEGGAGNDSLNGGPHQDQCIGGAGTNTHLLCEIQSG